MDVHGVHKICSACGELKELGEFNKRKLGRGKRVSQCRQCIVLKNARRKVYPVTVNEKRCNTCGVTKGAGEFNRHRVDPSGLQSNCRPCSNAAGLKHAKDYPEMNCARAAKRKAAKLKRRPPWADESRIRAIYTEATRIQDETGVAHQVDHLIPLQGLLVSGLDWEGNMQVLSAKENNSKNNRWNPWTGKAEAPCPQAVMELTSKLENK